jgi:hypothetical protein
MPAVENGPMLVPPLDVGTVPPQPSVPEPPLAVQEAALLVVHDRVVPWPVDTLVDAALNAVIDAAELGGLLTLMVTELGAPVPPGPMQVNV